MFFGSRNNHCKLLYHLSLGDCRRNTIRHHHTITIKVGETTTKRPHPARSRSPRRSNDLSHPTTRPIERPRKNQADRTTKKKPGRSNNQEKTRPIERPRKNQADRATKKKPGRSNDQEKTRPIERPRKNQADRTTNQITTRSTKRPTNKQPSRCNDHSTDHHADRSTKIFDNQVVRRPTKLCRLQSGEPIKASNAKRP